MIAKYIILFYIYRTKQITKHTMEEEKILVENAIKALDTLQNRAVYQNKDLERNLHWVAIDSVIGMLKSAIENS